MKTAEDIVKEKKYFELTEDERQLVNELATNEEEFDQLKYLLSQSNDFFNSRKVEASNEMREHIMEKLYPPSASSLKWYQTLWLFLFPAEKSFYQYPAFQLVGVLLIFVGLFSVWQNPFENDNLAKNTVVVDIQEQGGNTAVVELDSISNNIIENSNSSQNIKEDAAEPVTIEMPKSKIIREETSNYSKTEDLKDRFVTEDLAAETSGKVGFDLEETKALPSAPLKEKEAAAPIINVQNEMNDEIAISANEGKKYSELNRVEPTTISVLEKKSNKAISMDLFRDKKEVSSISVDALKEIRYLFFEVK